MAKGGKGNDRASGNLAGAAPDARDWLCAVVLRDECVFVSAHERRSRLEQVWLSAALVVPSVSCGLWKDVRIAASRETVVDAASRQAVCGAYGHTVDGTRRAQWVVPARRTDSGRRK